MHAPRHRPPSRLRAARLLALLTATSAVAAGAVAGPAAASTGPYPTRYEEPTTLRNHTVFRPSTLPAKKLPVLIWGQSGCIANGLIFKDALREIASWGIVVIASGGPNQLGTTTVGYMNRSLEWAKEQDGLAGGLYEGKLETARVAVAGHSCGGLEALQFAATHPEVAALGVMNSGQLQPNQAQLDAVKAPTLFLLGGPGDVANQNGYRDFSRLDPTLPAFLAADNNGHFGTWYQKDGGGYARILKNWIKYRIEADGIAARQFTGTLWAGWKIQRRNIS